MRCDSIENALAIDEARRRRTGAEFEGIGENCTSTTARIASRARRRAVARRGFASRAPR
jgi:hypothetical protein